MSNDHRQEKSMSKKFLRGLKVLGYGKATVEAEEVAEKASNEAEKEVTNNQKKIEEFREKYSEAKNSGKDLNIKW